MADPISPTPEQTKQWNDFTVAAKNAGLTLQEALTKASGALKDMTSNSLQTIVSFENLQNYLKDVKNDLTGMTTSTNAAKLGFLGLSAAAINARESFQNIAGVDPGSINTFAGQISQLKASLGGTPMVAALARGSISSLLDSMKDKIAPDIFKNLKSASNESVLKFITNLAAKADNMTRLQASLFAVSAATGNLSKIYEKTGTDLNNINEVLAEHNAAMHATVAATHAAPAAVESYYMALGRIPGALESTVSSGTAAGGNMNMLTAVMRMAAGNGREVSKVIEDMHLAFKNFNMSTEQAATFVNRFSELSNNLGVEFDDMKSSLLAASGAFKDIGDAGKHQEGIIDGLTGVMNKYIFALKEAGMTGKHAAEVAAGVAEGFTKMSVGQRAFLSAQTGGPGGLLGGLQIQKMLRDNDIPGMQKKMMEAMQKQLGPIITMDEALKGGQAGAAKFERQVQLMTKGPLASGMGIKTEMDAIKMLDAMKAMSEGKATPKELLPGAKSLQGSMDKGLAIQERSATALSSINTLIDGVNRSTDFLAAGFAATNFGIARGANAELGELQKARRADMEKAAKEGGSGAYYLQTQMKTAGVMPDRSDEFRGKAIVAITDSFKNLASSVSDKLKPLVGAATSGDQSALIKENQNIAKEIKEKLASKTTSAAEKLQLTELDSARKKIMETASSIKAEKAEAFNLSGAATKTAAFPAMPTGKPLETAAATVAAKGVTRMPEMPTGTPTPYTAQVIQESKEGAPKITVRVTVDDRPVSDNQRSIANIPTP